MKVDRLVIENFGHFSKREVVLAPGLNVLWGRNEAGKSTLLAFVRAMLFGFEPANSSENRYEPMNGNAMAGQLFVSNASKQLVIRREKKRNARAEFVVRDVQGSSLAPEVLAEQMGGISKELFFQVFAFGLSELMSFEKLAASGGAAEALFAAGIQGAQKLPQAVQHLTSSSDELFRPQGSTKLLNSKIHELGDVKKSLEAMGDRPAEYFEAQSRLLHLEKDAQQIELQLSECHQEFMRIGRLKDASADLKAWAAAKEEASQTPEMSSFPADGLARLDKCLADIEAISHQEGSVTQGLENVEMEFSNYVSDTDIERRCASGNAALMLFQSRRNALQTLDGRWAGFLERKKQTATALSKLGLNSELSAFLKTDFSAAAKARLQADASVLLDKDKQLYTQTESFKKLSEQVLAREEDMRALQKGIEVLPADAPDDIRAREEALEHLERESAEAAALTDSVAARKLTIARLKNESQVAPEAALPRWLLPLVGVLCLGTLVWVFGQPSGRVVFSGVVVGVLALLAMLDVRLRRHHRRQLEKYESQKQATLAELSFHEGEAQKASARLAQLQDSMAHWASKAGLSVDADKDTVLRARFSLKQRRDDVEKRRGLEKSLEDLARHLARENAARAASKTAIDELTNEINALRKRVDDWTMERGLGKGLLPSSALDMCSEAAALQQKILDLDAEEKELNDERLSENECRSLLEVAATGLGISVSTGAKMDVLAQSIEEALRKERVKEDMRLKLSERRKALEIQRVDLEKRRLQSKQALDSLLSQAQCADAEALRQKGLLAAQYDALKKRLSHHESCARAALGTTPLPSAWETILSLGGEAGVALHLSSLEEKRASLSQHQREMATELGRLTQKLSEWANDGAAASLRGKEETLMSELARHAATYIRQRISLGLLRRARERVERERQPKVIEAASALFSTLTEGRYPKLYSPLDGKRELRLLDANGQEWEPEQLSRGTRELLYLAFRMAVIEDFGASRVPLPIFLDDILVNFDDERRSRTLEAFRQLSSKHQLIALTCHAAQKEAFQQMGANILEV